MLQAWVKEKHVEANGERGHREPFETCPYPACGGIRQVVVAMSPLWSVIFGFISVAAGLASIVAIALLSNYLAIPRPDLSGFAVGCAAAAVVIIGALVLLGPP